MSDVLLPCPFCGHAAAIYNDSFGDHWARCPDVKNCGVSFPQGRGTSTREQAVRRWNERTPETTKVQAVVDELERDFPLPRCHHGSALRDHAGERLVPVCGCIEAKPESLPRGPEHYETPGAGHSQADVFICICGFTSGNRAAFDLHLDATTPAAPEGQTP